MAWAPLLTRIAAAYMPAALPRVRCVCSQAAATEDFTGHVSVMLDEVVRAVTQHPLSPNPLFVDATFGGGGHAKRLLDDCPTAKLFGFDRDDSAIRHSHKLNRDDRLEVFHSSYIHIKERLQDRQVQSVQAIIADLGLSNHQLDFAPRGFTWRQDAKLDMRFDPHGARITAADLVNSLPQAELARILSLYGEEPLAGPIASAICRRRAHTHFTHTLDLATAINETASFVATKKGWRPKDATGPGVGSQSVTRCFQALRIAVNSELEAVSQLLKLAPAMINPSTGGVIAVLTFHSLEDRLVKTAFKQLVQDSQPGVGPARRGNEDSALFTQARTRSAAGQLPVDANTLRSQTPARWAYVHKGGLLLPSNDEVNANRRARSAKLRAVQLLPG